MGTAIAEPTPVRSFGTGAEAGSGARVGAGPAAPWWICGAAPAASSFQSPLKRLCRRP
ncbi:hypothetical protein STVIR_0757 [Streptomyces viridochromogenes Tue57]|uniref:Uncharacterized protein n=1 Tax=Streptomyces viridochromogenes Tue57 TaxID=1160705 RepID=L8PSB0_STRVR|nr:hypothetical protein STVIR_0757 [Streptomyces viridochromogenes Tue57]